ncbi:MAG: triose-phosphate isomerase [Caulobacteraceae bacterium]
MDKTRRLVAGNWKMNGSSAALKEAQSVSQALTDQPADCRVALFPPSPLISRMSDLLQGGPVEVGAQDSHAEKCGAYTGDASPEILYDAGARLVILGHSERRGYYRETDELVARKVVGALRGGLEPVICVGESLQHHKAGETAEVVQAQLEASLPRDLDGHAFAVAYEPCWAIGTGLTPTLAEIEAVHTLIHEVLARLFPQSRNVPALYGGSVTPANAADILKVQGVDGALVGGASLKAADFLAIVRAAG